MFYFYSLLILGMSLASAQAAIVRETIIKPVSTIIEPSKKDLDEGSQWKVDLESTRVEKLFSVDTNGERTLLNTEEKPYVTATVQVKIGKVIIFDLEKLPRLRLNFDPRDSSQPVYAYLEGFGSNFFISQQSFVQKDDGKKPTWRSYNFDVTIGRSSNSWPVVNLDVEFARNKNNLKKYDLYVMNNNCDPRDTGSVILEGEVIQERRFPLMPWNAIYKFWTVLEDRGCSGESQINLDELENSADRVDGRGLIVRYRIYREGSPHYGSSPSYNHDSNRI